MLYVRIEMECPHMIRDSVCGSPAVFLDQILYHNKYGIYAGLEQLSPDCDVYLIYCLVMIASACKRAITIAQYNTIFASTATIAVANKGDIVSLQTKLNEIDRMLSQCLLAKAMSHDAVFTGNTLTAHSIPLSLIIITEQSTSAHHLHFTSYYKLLSYIYTITLLLLLLLLAVIYIFLDCFLLGQRPCSSLGKYDLKHLTR